MRAALCPQPMQKCNTNLRCIPGCGRWGLSASAACAPSARQQREQSDARQNDEAGGGLWNWNGRRIERVQRVRSHQKDFLAVVETVSVGIRV